MSKQEERDLFGPRHLSQALPKVKPPSRIKQRVIESAVQIEAEGPDSILYQHTATFWFGSAPKVLSISKYRLVALFIPSVTGHRVALGNQAETDPRALE